MAKNYNLARTSSLARSSREEQALEENPIPATGMSLDAFYLALGKAAKSDFEAGRLTQSAYIARLNTLRTQYATLKGQVA